MVEFRDTQQVAMVRFCPDCGDTECERLKPFADADFHNIAWRCLNRAGQARRQLIRELRDLSATVDELRAEIVTIRAGAR